MWGRIRIQNMSFTQQVLQTVIEIPKGETLSYQQVAAVVGSPRASRAVGSIMKKNFDRNIPCHRVICSDGSIGGYNRGIANKRKMLIKEGCNNFNNN